MKKCTAILFLIAVTSSAFYKVFVMAEYRINRNYIAAVLCENRSRPHSCCNGMCYVKKKMQKQEDEEKSNKGKEESPSVRFCEENASAGLIRTTSLKEFAAYSQFLPSRIRRPVFHPPGGGSR